MTGRLKTLAAIGVLAVATFATASSAFADRNQYTHRHFANPRPMHRMHAMHHRMHPMRHHRMMRHHAM